MDTPREPAFDNLVYTVAQLFRAPIAMLGLVDSSRVWAKASVGQVGCELNRSAAFCLQVVESGQLLIVEDATVDGRFSNLGSMQEEPRIRFFAGAPLYGPGRHAIGTLCVLDHHARSVGERQQSHLLQLAQEAGELLRLRVPDLDLSV